MGRPKSKAFMTAFGRFLEKRGITYEEAASSLGITRQYANFIGIGRTMPGRSLMFRIEAWARSKGGSIPVSSWQGKGYAQQ